MYINILICFVSFETYHILIIGIGVYHVAILDIGYVNFVIFKIAVSLRGAVLPQVTIFTNSRNQLKGRCSGDDWV